MIKRPVFPGILPGKAGRAFSGIVQCCRNVCTLQSECWFRLCPALIFREKLQPSNVRRMTQRMHYPNSYLSANGFREAATFQAGYDTTCECIETLDLNALQRLALLEVCLMCRALKPDHFGMRGRTPRLHCCTSLVPQTDKRSR